MHWKHTATGRAIDLLDPKPSQIAIADIAHALAGMCRYNGHTSSHYSVAEHSIGVAGAVLREGADQATAFAALMHDAHEMIVGDVASPMKQAMRHLSAGGDSAFDSIERLAWMAVAHRFGLPIILPDVVKRADLRMLATEAPHLLPWPPPREWSLPAWATPYPGVVPRCWSAPFARAQFLRSFVGLCPNAADVAEARALIGERPEARL